MMSSEEKKGEIIIYECKDGAHFDVTLQDETIWLTQKQIAFLFNVKRPAVTKHLNNIFKGGELKEKSVSSKMEHTAKDGKTYKTTFYNLDAIISVGYRVNSANATHFRIWATGVLREHILKGYTINEKRLKEMQTHKLKELEKTVSLLQSVMRSKSLSDGEMKGLLSVVTDYAHAWALLQQYDTGELKTPKKTTRGISPLEPEEASEAIRALKHHLAKKNEGSDIFGVERRAGSIGGILLSIRQSFGGKELYPSLEEKAAHLLYFTIKQHPFVDGNKRIASLLFIFFLSKNQVLAKTNGERKINDNALVALALLIAESKPSEKEIMVSLVANLLATD